MAIINQKSGEAQGSPNPVFYALASQQTPADCSSTNPSASSSCIFHDVQIGGNAGACYGSDTGARDCSALANSYNYGVVDGNAATAGYDLASGLGSVDIKNLVNNWAAVSLARGTTTTALALSSKAVTYGGSQTATISVASGTGTPTGNVSILPSSTAVDADISSPGTLSNGSATISLALLPVGSYAVTAHYAGDTNYQASNSAAQNITVAQAATALSTTLSRATLLAGQSSTLQMVVSASGSGLAPTGTVHVVNTTSGSDLGTFSLNSSATVVAASYFLNIAPTALLGGANTLSISYSGNSNYAASATTASISFAAPMALTLGSSSLTLTTGASANSAGTALTVTAANGGSLSYPISLSCTGTLPSGASCGLSSTVLASPATAATVTVGFTPPVSDARMVVPHSGFSLKPLAALGFGLLLLAGRKRKLFAPLLVLLITGVGVLTLSSCGSSAKTTSTVTLSPSTTSLSLGSPLTLTSTVSYANARSSVLLGSIQITDTFRGASHLLGTITPSTAIGTTGSGSLTTSSLGIGAHSIVAVYSGSPGATSSAVAVNVTNRSTLAITAIDANGNTVTVPLEVTLQ
jgi:hypothetical protein